VTSTDTIAAALGGALGEAFGGGAVEGALAGSFENMASGVNGAGAGVGAGGVGAGGAGAGEGSIGPTGGGMDTGGVGCGGGRLEGGPDAGDSVTRAACWIAPGTGAGAAFGTGTDAAMTSGFAAPVGCAACWGASPRCPCDRSATSSRHPPSSNAKPARKRGHTVHPP
jgi:hypothetical protein